MSESESDVEPKPKTKKKTLKQPDSGSEEILTGNDKKMTTKMMIKETLTELKSRKGTSLFAIKKHLTEKYQVDTEKNNYLIKKTLRNGVEDGTIIQVKGIGASGSFKLANIKEKKAKKPKPKEEKKKMEKPKTTAEKTKTTAEKTKATAEKTKTTVEKTQKTVKKAAEKKIKSKINVSEEIDKKIVEKIKKSKSKTSMKLLSTPAKKKTHFNKRKSIGSIIKPPKMKPTRT